MSDKMTRDDLLTLMRAWGWTLTGSLANGRADLWSHRNGMDEVIIPGAGTAPDYDRMLRQAESIIARAEGPRLLAVVREVAAANERYMRGEIDAVSLSVDIHAALGSLTGHGGMLGTEDGEGA